MKAPAFWQMTMTVSAHGATVLTDEWEESTSLVREGEELVPGPTGMHASVVWWSCKRPGTMYSYVLTAERLEESPITKTGTFVGATQRQCEQALRIYLRKHGEEVRRRQAAARRKRGEELARQRRFESNCRIVGGEPVTIQTSRGPYVVCRSQTGGIVEV